MHHIAGDFITDHCNSTTIKQLEFGPEPTALGRMTNLAFMETNNKGLVPVLWLYPSVSNDFPSHRLGKVSLGLCTLL